MNGYTRRVNLPQYNNETLMALRFFPRDSLFWRYHLGASAFCMAVTLLTIFLWSPLVKQDSVATIVWLLPYTLAVLGFRWLYRARRWQALPMARLIAIAVAYASATAVLVALAVAAFTLPFFWDALIAWYAVRDVRLSLGPHLLQTVSSASLQAQVFICAWIFIYISFTGSRDVRERELDNARLQAALREAQLHSLSNQLNPHFLFNSLNNIRFMIHEDADRADAMLVGLSDILRYSLRAGEHGKVSLGEELEVIERYLAIVGVQLEARLRCRIDIPADLSGCLVPPLLLQGLVENAVKHGIEPQREGGTLIVSGRRSGKNARELLVANDKPVAGSGPGLGIGLPHLARRLALLYGERAMHTVADSGSEFRVTLTLPLERSA
ncbi:sensor histidine kinase [Massilia sp. Se16.2.3]|uniref:sensor histidine kinase n=1 Tax=Massilia sp. Se16.2.3 TaxID=2709303 RepID=UPI0016022202|nr:histidine kinase [Massilia sp. Se16.2.3]QNA98583.1 histidine kinase [Massilia sp. Se16.2.3]